MIDQDSERRKRIQEIFYAVALCFIREGKEEDYNDIADQFDFDYESMQSFKAVVSGTLKHVIEHLDKEENPYLAVNNLISEGSDPDDAMLIVEAVLHAFGLSMENIKK